MPNIVVLTIANRQTGKLESLLELNSLKVEDLYDLYGMNYADEFLDIELFDEDLKFLSNDIPVSRDFLRYRYFIGLVSKSDGDDNSAAQ